MELTDLGSEASHIPLNQQNVKLCFILVYFSTKKYFIHRFLASLIVVLGEFDLSDDYEPKKTIERNVKRVVVHKGYIARTFDNDLALLELAQPVRFDEHIIPICLPENEHDYVGDIGHVTGWGRLSYGLFNF